jgi:Predicted acyltransferase
MEVKLAKLADATRVVDIIEQNKMYLKSEDIPQWQDGYPNLESITEDIEKGNCYILIDNHQIVGTAALIDGIEETYDNILNGSWFTEGTPYVTIHRLAVDPELKGKGLSNYFIEYCIKTFTHCTSIRIDTHENNISMQKFLAKNGFNYCGEITLRDGSPRLAFELLMQNYCN